MNNGKQTYCTPSIFSGHRHCTRWFVILLVLLLHHLPLKAFELNGYYFSEDSAEIWQNRYFSQYDPAGATPLLIYGSRLLQGYGAFGFDVAQFYDEFDTYTFTDDEGIERTINCVVRREHGYWPEFIPHVVAGDYELSADLDGSETVVTLANGIEPSAWPRGFVSLNDVLHEYESYAGREFNLMYALGMAYLVVDTEVNHVIPAHFMSEEYTRYEYLAKDSNDNIHVLRSMRYEDDSDEDLNDKDIIVEGGTTLMYPQNPVANMPVYYSGIVVDPDADGVTVPLGGGVYDNCLVISKIIETSLGSDTEAEILLYLSPGEGEVWAQYDWGDPISGSTVTMLSTDQISGFKKIGDFDHPGSSVSVALNGHVFGPDSTSLWENTFFSDYTASTLSDYSKILYGYNDFAGYDSRHYYQGTGRYQNIECVVIYKHDYMVSGSSATLVKCFDYLAKDSEDNIHLLQRIVAGDSENSVLHDQDILHAGGSTILYPAVPALEQIVYGGYVSDLDAAVVYTSGGLDASELYTDCVSIKMGSGPGSYTVYYAEGSGDVAVTYDSGARGFTVEEDIVAAGLTRGTDGSTGTVGTGGTSDTGTVAVADDDDDLKWYQCFIAASGTGSPDHALVFLLLVSLAVLGIQISGKSGAGK